MWARQLTREEREYVGKSDFGKKMISLRQISIMGCDNNYRLKYLDVKVTPYRQYLGDGQYIDEYRGGGKAEGGKKVPIIWSSDAPLGYILDACEELNILVFRHPSYHDVLYFESIYSEAFLRAVLYVNHALRRWYEKRPIFIRWFGPISPDRDSKEVKAIDIGVRAILTKVRESQSYPYNSIHAPDIVKILSVHFNASNNNYEINHIESNVRNGYKVLFTGPETDCRNLISYGIAGVSLEKNPVLLAAQSK